MSSHEAADSSHSSAHQPPLYHDGSEVQSASTQPADLSTPESATSTLHHNLEQEEVADLPQRPRKGASFLEPADKLARSASRTKSIDPASGPTVNAARRYPAVGSNQPIQASPLSRQNSNASQRPTEDPPFPSVALALSRSISAPGAIYIDWERDDKGNPMNWPKARRWMSVICCFAFTGATSIIATAYNAGESQVTSEFGCSSTVFLLGNTTYLVSVAFAPLVLAPFSELVGRQVIFLISAFLTAALLIPQALAYNIEGILIPRIIQGAAASAGNSVTGGIVADLFSPHERGFPMSVFALVVFVTQSFGPVSSSYTVLYHGWRISFWWQAGVAFLSFAAMVLLFRETRGPVLLSRRAAKMTKDTGGKIVYRCRADDERRSISQMIVTSVTRPLLYLLTEPIVTAFALWIGFLWATVFLSIQSIPISFGEAYGWTSQQSSFVLLVLGVGGFIGWLMNLWQEKLYERDWKKYNGDPPPESRLYLPCVGGVMVPIGLFWFAWTCQSSVHPAAPIVGLVVFAAGVFPIYMGVFVYLSDIYLRYASSGLAAQSFLRNALAGCFPLFASQMYYNLGPPYASTVLACIASALGVCPFLLLWKGSFIRSHSRVAKALAKEQREEEERREQEEAKKQRREQRRIVKEQQLAQFKQQQPQGERGEIIDVEKSALSRRDHQQQQQEEEQPIELGEKANEDIAKHMAST